MSPLLAAFLGAGMSGAGVALFLRGRWLREAREASSLKDQLARERSNRAESQAAENARQQALFENMLEGVLLVDAFHTSEGEAVGLKLASPVFAIGS